MYVLDASACQSPEEMDEAIAAPQGVTFFDQMRFLLVSLDALVQQIKPKREFFKQMTLARRLANNVVERITAASEEQERVIADYEERLEETMRQYQHNTGVCIEQSKNIACYARRLEMELARLEEVPAEEWDVYFHGLKKKFWDEEWSQPPTYIKQAANESNESNESNQSNEPTKSSQCDPDVRAEIEKTVKECQLHVEMLNQKYNIDLARHEDVIDQQYKALEDREETIKKLQARLVEATKNLEAEQETRKKLNSTKAGLESEAVALRVRLEESDIALQKSQGELDMSLRGQEKAAKQACADQEKLQRAIGQLEKAGQEKDGELQMCRDDANELRQRVKDLRSQLYREKLKWMQRRVARNRLVQAWRWWQQDLTSTTGTSSDTDSVTTSTMSLSSVSTLPPASPVSSTTSSDFVGQDILALAQAYAECKQKVTSLEETLELRDKEIECLNQQVAKQDQTQQAHMAYTESVRQGYAATDANIVAARAAVQSLVVTAMQAQTTLDMQLEGLRAKWNASNELYPWPNNDNQDNVE